MSPLVVAFAALMLGLFLGAVASSFPRPEPRKRMCLACGHERGWHQTYWPTDMPFSRGCAHPGGPFDCGCPAGRRSIR